MRIWKYYGLWNRKWFNLIINMLCINDKIFLGKQHFADIKLLCTVKALVKNCSLVHCERNIHRFACFVCVMPNDWHGYGRICFTNRKTCLTIQHAHTHTKSMAPNRFKRWNAQRDNKHLETDKWWINSQFTIWTE